MCHIFSGQSRKRYSFQTRSVRLSGHATSIRLESAFWTVLEEIAAKQDVSLPKFLTKLHDEVLDFDGEATNFASLLRCACLTYIDEIRTNAAAEATLLAQSRKEFSVQVRKPAVGTSPRVRIMHAPK